MFGEPGRRAGDIVGDTGLHWNAGSTIFPSMPSLHTAPTLRDKLETLAADAQYDLSCACGTAPDDRRRRGLDDRWLYPVALQSGGRSLMFKTLLSNACTHDCRSGG